MQSKRFDLQSLPTGNGRPKNAFQDSHLIVISASLNISRMQLRWIRISNIMIDGSSTDPICLTALRIDCIEQPMSHAKRASWLHSFASVGGVLYAARKCIGPHQALLRGKSAPSFPESVIRLTRSWSQINSFSAKVSLILLFLQSLSLQHQNASSFSPHESSCPMNRSPILSSPRFTHLFSIPSLHSPAC